MLCFEYRRGRRRRRFEEDEGTLEYKYDEKNNKYILRDQKLHPFLRYRIHTHTHIEYDLFM